MQLKDLAAQSGVVFGTSGARGLVAQMSDRVCFLYVTAFLSHLKQLDEFASGDRIAVGGDLRPSTPRIAAACAESVRLAGGVPVFCGAISSPALALYGLSEGIGTVMVTGSHIPADRNGIKFTRRSGEIDKRDEAAMMEMAVEAPPALFDAQGAWIAPPSLPFRREESEPHRLYQDRAVSFFGTGALSGMRLGFYQHSGVARDLIPSILEALGATVERLSPSEIFVPVDTEAIRSEDRVLAREWAASGRFDAILSTDGDADRPLLADETGEWWSGDRLGLLAARALGIKAIAVPVSTTTAAELSRWFDVRRTKIGSPYVIEGMQQLEHGGENAVAGFEANGGFLLQTPLIRAGRLLPSLPTRDVVLPLVAVLRLAVEQKVSVSALLRLLPKRATASGRLKEFPNARSRAALSMLIANRSALAEWFRAATSGEEVAEIDETDGLRMIGAEGTVVHLRASGNAPEFRCYVECATSAAAENLLSRCLAAMELWNQ